MPDLDFAVLDADVLPFAAVPTLLFRLRVANATPDERIHAILLRAQIRIEARQRHYDGAAEERLLEIFGEPRRWGETLRSLLWTNVTLNVPGFTGDTVVELPLTCTYDFEVVATKYLHALADGEAPLLFLFSGTVFYADSETEGPRVAPIPWEKEAPFRMPVRLWRAMMDRYFPHCAWLRLRTDIFDQLYQYRTRAALPTWEAALEQLLAAHATEVER